MQDIFSVFHRTFTMKRFEFQSTLLQKADKERNNRAYHVP